MRSRVLLLMPATSYRAADFVGAASRLGAGVAVATDQSQTLEKKASASVLSLDFRQPEAAVAKILEFAKKFPISAVVGVEDDTTLIAALAGEALGLPHNSVESVRRARDKSLARACLREAGLRVPQYQKVSLSEDPLTLAERTEYPCVVKPLFLSASRGVIRANDPDEFRTAFERLRSLLRAPEVSSKGGESARWVLIESFVPGKEVALEGLMVEGRLQTLAIFDKPDPLDGPFFEESIYVTPSRLPDSVQQEIRSEMGKAVQALGLTGGPIHGEARVNSQGIWPLEVAARSIGGLCSRTLRFGIGVTLEELILRHALGRDISLLKRQPKPAGVMMIPIPRAGRLKAFGGIEAAIGIAGVESVSRSIPIGQEVVPLPEGSRYLGFIFARADTPEEVESVLRKARQQLEVVIVPDSKT